MPQGSAADKHHMLLVLIINTTLTKARKLMRKVN